MDLYIPEIIEEFLQVDPAERDAYVKEHRGELGTALKRLARRVNQLEGTKELHSIVEAFISYQEEVVYVTGVHRYNPLKHMKEMQTVHVFSPQEYLVFMADFVLRNRKVEKELTMLFESVLQENIKGL